MPGCKNRGVMVTDGAHTAHQLLGTVNRFICSKEFCKGSIMCPCETLHGLHFDCSLREAPRGNTISSSVQFGSGPMGVGSQSVFFLSAQHLARRMNVMADWQTTHFTDSRIMPRSHSGLDADSRALCQGPLCRQAEYPVTSVLQLEAGSDGYRC